MTHQSSTGRWLAPTLHRVRGRARRVSSLRRPKTREAQRETPPIGQFLTVDGVRLHYVERGRGEPLVLIHGNGMMIQRLFGQRHRRRPYRALPRHHHRPTRLRLQRPPARSLDAPRSRHTVPEGTSATWCHASDRARTLVGSAGRGRPRAPGSATRPQPRPGLRVLLPTLRADVLLASPVAIPGIAT